VIELSIVAGGHSFEAVPAEVSIELVKQAHQGQVMRWNLLFKPTCVVVAEGRESRRHQPLVDIVDTD